MQIGSRQNMENISKTKVELFHQSLLDPTLVSDGDMAQLMKEFPYSQPLRFAYERRRSLLNEPPVDTAMALLYAHQPAWLAEYVRKDVIIIPVEQVGHNEYVVFEDMAAQASDEESDMGNETDAVDARTMETTNSLMDVDMENHANIQNEGIGDIGAAFEFSSLLDNKESEFQRDIVENSVAADEMEEERVSIYNDHLMPYSFLWWLHKTRLEHADTYQPFVEPRLPKPEKGQFDLSKLDEKILDQQIREHVFRTQSPEEKLSEEVKEKVVIPSPPKKIDEVIEKFIREEPQIKPPQADQLNMENKARKSAEDQFTLVTETLAIIYTDQGLYPKAIDVYKKLILKFPEKNAYFASRITELEQKLN